MKNVFSLIAVFSVALSLISTSAVARPAPRGWGGGHIGGFVGGAWTSFNHAWDDPGPTGTVAGFSGGGGLGFNWQSGPFVFGGVADFATLDNRYSDPWIKFSEDWMGTVRGRLGYDLGPVLPYASAGVAFTDVLTKIYDYGQEHRVATGFTAGAGVDIALPGSWFMRVEYLFVDVPKGKTSVDDISVEGGSSNNIVRAGVNYRF